MLKDLYSRIGSRLTVIATRPAVPFNGLGAFLGNSLIYIDSVDDIEDYWQLLVGSNVFIHTGWGFNKINEIDIRLKLLRPDIKIYVLVDNRLKYSLRQIIGSIYFRVFMRKLYDGYIVAGKSSYRLMKFFGVKE